MFMFIIHAYFLTHSVKIHFKKNFDFLEPQRPTRVGRMTFVGIIIFLCFSYYKLYETKKKIVSQLRATVSLSQNLTLQQELKKPCFATKKSNYFRSLFMIILYFLGFENIR